MRRANKYLRLDGLKALLVLVVTFVLAGCAPERVKPDISHMNRFEEGVTTYQDVISVMGAPNAITSSSSGKKTLVYNSVNTKVDSAMLIPIFGPMLGGVTSEVRMISFSFDGDILEKMDYTEANARATAFGGVQ